ncbi:CDP-glycerol glycerophosphotransferase family protein [Virgibacillus sp. 7505]|uniref:CDP-glycerol glycerophosphotransferase family protein n=1 Tax=Virgibacillus sp. 7505 TaxID=2022548 RepID=UPI0015956F37|nr:CDP-glycerol glycerophosphotransferase family protein [Virgibacillus sp. 7505]
MSVYSEVSNGSLVFKDGFLDFNGSVNLITRKRSSNKKYYVYDAAGQIITEENDESHNVTIKEIVYHKGKQVIFYLDKRMRLSFIVTRKHKSLTEEQIIEKAELAPSQRVWSIPLLNMILFIGVLRFRYINIQEYEIALGYDKKHRFPIKYLFSKTIREKNTFNTSKLKLLYHTFFCIIPAKDLERIYIETSSINLPMFLRIHNDTANYYYPFKKSGFDKYSRKHYLYNTFNYRISKSLSVFIRKSVTGQLVFVYSNKLHKSIVIKEAIAYVFVKVFARKNNRIILFEKFCEGASESAYEIFKYARQQNDSMARFIIDSKSDLYPALIEQFGSKYIIKKNTLRSFYNIFKADALISSDLATHIQRRLYDNDRLIKKKILDNKNKIFLQHGVALATNVFERGYFNKRVPIAPDYIVTSSRRESRNFLKYANYTDDDIIPTGLPNLDLYVESKETVQKDEITFMLTWRPWDLTGGKTEGSYVGRYIQFIRMINSDPFYEGKKINVVLHPKAKVILRDQFPAIYADIQSKLYAGDIKDILLKTKVLISDYSSVTFYAFAGGSNVIFYWEDKVKAEKEYGARNILQKENAFGDIIYDFDQLNAFIQSNYIQEQKAAYQSKFSLMVERTDGNNTEETYNYIREILDKERGLADVEYRNKRILRNEGVLQLSGQENIQSK